MSFPIIEVHNLSKTIQNKKIIDNIGLCIEKGDIYAFLGPNGSGKTTIMRLICGLLKADVGSEGMCLGYNLMKNTREIRKHIGYMTQHFSLYTDLSIYENLQFIGRLFHIPHCQERIQFIIDKFKFKHPKQLAGSLSGGWKQRLALACATLHQPQILLLDEPTAGVDPEARRIFWEEIQSLSQQGTTILVSTHYMEEIEHCNKLLYLFQGKIILSGYKEAIKQNIPIAIWEIFGPDKSSLIQLAFMLSQNFNEIYSIQHISNKLRISISTEKITDFSYYQKNPYQWHQVEPTIEDVFIYYLKHPYL